MNAVCRRYISNKEEIKDVLQEGFIKVFNNLDKYRGDGPVEAWIRRIIVNTALSYIRKSKTDLYSSQDVNDHDDSISVTEEADESVFNADFDQNDLMAAINCLPENYKIIFNLHCIEDYSHKEIAQELSITEENSRTRLNRARKLLQEYLNALHKTRLKN